MLKDTTDVPVGMVGMAKLPLASVVAVRPPPATATPGIGLPFVESTTMPIRPVTPLPLLKVVPEGPELPNGLLLRLSFSAPPPQDRSDTATHAASAPKISFFIFPPYCDPTASLPQVRRYHMARSLDATSTAGFSSQTRSSRQAITGFVRKRLFAPYTWRSPMRDCCVT